MQFYMHLPAVSDSAPKVWLTYLPLRSSWHSTKRSRGTSLDSIALDACIVNNVWKQAFNFSPFTLIRFLQILSEKQNRSMGRGMNRDFR